MASTRLRKQLQFIVEVDKLKQILRQTSLIDNSRRENSGEHSWHIALMALVLAEYVDEETDLLRTLKMLLIHDTVEIDAGDTFAYDEIGALDKEEREEKAAQRIFGLLPDDQRDDFYALWREFEGRRTPEAKLANAMDRLMPSLHNFESGGGTWGRTGIDRGRVATRLHPIDDASHELWSYVEDMLDDAVEQGMLAA